jgi:hypothetical protein
VFKFLQNRSQDRVAVQGLQDIPHSEEELIIAEASQVGDLPIDQTLSSVQ